MTQFTGDFCCEESHHFLGIGAHLALLWSSWWSSPASMTPSGRILVELVAKTWAVNSEYLQEQFLRGCKSTNVWNPYDFVAKFPTFSSWNISILWENSFFNIVSNPGEHRHFVRLPYRGAEWWANVAASSAGPRQSTWPSQLDLHGPIFICQQKGKSHLVPMIAWIWKFFQSFGVVQWCIESKLHTPHGFLVSPFQMVDRPF